MSLDAPATPPASRPRKSLYPSAGDDAGVRFVHFPKGTPCPGPSSNNERFEWPDYGWRQMDTAHQDRLVRNLRRLWLTDNMSGFSCPTLIFFYITRFLKTVIGIDVPNIRCQTSCDIQLSRRDTLKSYDDEWRPRHIFQDHLERLGEHRAVCNQKLQGATVEEKRSENAELNKKIQAAYELHHCQHT